MSEKSGRCLCGAVKFTATPKASRVDACHCDTCRKQVGGPVMAVDCGGAVRFADESKLGVYQSSDWAERGFCPACGTALFWRLKDRSMYTINAGAFDNLDGFSLETEIFVDSKPDYYDFAQDTTKLTGQQVFEMFAGGQEN